MSPLKLASVTCVATLLALSVLSACATSDAPPSKGDGSGAKTDGAKGDAGPCAAVDCDDKLSCTIDRCVAGKCTHEIKGGECLIDSKCYKTGDTDGRKDTCNTCNAGNSQTAWTGDVSICSDDGKSCTDTRCGSDGLCKHDVDATSCLVDGACYTTGEDDPNNDCLACNPAVSKTTLTPKADSTPCSADVLSCTEDACKQGKCEHPIKTDTCLIGGACYAKGEVNPTADCQVCDPDKEQVAWSTQQDGASCGDDGLGCTDDRCQAGACTHPLKPDTCLIGTSCFSKDDTNPQAECQVCAPAVSTTAWSNKADTTPCTSDGLACTTDQCKTGVCEHPIDAGNCLIGGVCYADGAPNTGVQCRQCIAAQSQTQWSVSPDTTPCASDGLACTTDQCESGSCAHPIKSDQCLISGVCYAADQQVGGAASCDICVPATSQTAVTVVNGRSCDDGDASTDVDTCLGTCRGFNAYSFEWTASDSDTRLNGVAQISSGDVWAVGQYRTSGGVTQGMIAKLAGNTVGPLVFVPEAMTSISHRIAVGVAGNARWFAGPSWTAPTSLGEVFTTDLYGVWGRTVAGQDVHYISGVGGVLSICSTGDGTIFNCVGQSVPGSPLLRRVVAAGPLASAFSRGWAMRGDVTEDIFSAAWSSSAWSTSPAHGCTDGPSSPCGNTSGRLLDMSSNADGTDIWAVGEAGQVLRYDGTSWKRIAIPTLTDPNARQSAYTFTAVHTDVRGQGRDVVIIAGHRNYGSATKDLILLFYNRTLDRWFAPRTLASIGISSSIAPSYQLNDIGGDPLNPTIVGAIWSAANAEQRALYLVRP